MRKVIPRLVLRRAERLRERIDELLALAREDDFDAKMLAYKALADIVLVVPEPPKAVVEESARVVYKVVMQMVREWRTWLRAHEGEVTDEILQAFLAHDFRAAIQADELDFVWTVQLAEELRNGRPNEWTRDRMYEQLVSHGYRIHEETLRRMLFEKKKATARSNATAKKRVARPKRAAAGSRVRKAKPKRRTESH